MNKKLFFVFVVCSGLAGIGVFSLSASFALDPNTSGPMIDAFKTKQEKILFDSPAFALTGANDVLEYEYRMNGLDALKARVAETQRIYTDKKNETSEARMTLEQALAQLDDAIKNTADSIESIRAQITEKKQKIQALEQASLALKKKIAANRQVILDYLANIYSEGNLIMNGSGEVDMMKALILTNNDTDFHLTDMTYKTLVAQLGQKFVDEYRSTVREYYINSIKTDEEQKNLSILEGNLQKQLTTLESQKTEKSHLLEITKGQEALYIQYIAEQEKTQTQISEAWQRASDDYQASFDRFMAQYDCNESDLSGSKLSECIRIRQFFVNETLLAKSEYASGTTNIFAWPVDSRRITTYFHDEAYYRYVGSQHEAIDIGSPQGSEIRAPADGYVYYINPPSSPATYAYLAIKHRDGFVTVYGHLSEIDVVPYQFVKQGDVIAKVGGTPGTPGAGPTTTGPHLHFEVWKNKQPVDPLRYLNIADIDYTLLPAVYQMKFIDDIVEKDGEGTDTSDYKVRFSLKGDTEEDRQKYLLNTYAAPSFRDWNMWVDTALDANIDPSFMMCIGLAETTLGNHLKTPNNVGNVGNTDDGSTVTFSSPQTGIAAMARTFNNKYLGKYQNISELSRWGNSTGPIYASSASNWHDNTVRCLSALKGKFVEDDYNFRINPIE